MATRSLLLVPVTLCLLLVLAAHGKQDRAVVIFCGTARCKSNPSRIISNATLHVTINGTAIATGKTTSAGRFLMAANVTSKDQLIALVSKKAVITAPPQACGVPADAAVKKLAAPADLNGHGILADSSEENLGDLVDDDIREIIGPQIIRILGDPNGGDDAIVDTLNSQNVGDSSEDNLDIVDVAIDVDAMPDVTDLLNFVEDSGLAVYDFLNTLDDFLGIPRLG